MISDTIIKMPYRKHKRYDKKGYKVKGIPGKANKPLRSNSRPNTLPKNFESKDAIIQKGKIVAAGSFGARTSAAESQKKFDKSRSAVRSKREINRLKSAKLGVPKEIKAHIASFLRAPPAPKHSIIEKSKRLKKERKEKKKRAQSSKK